jgi:hypothetical protein
VESLPLCRPEEVRRHEARDLPSDPSPLHRRVAEVKAGPGTGVVDLLRRVGEGVPVVRLLVTVLNIENATLSVPKNAASATVTAFVTQPWAPVYSGCLTNRSGVQDGSASVAGLPSVSPAGLHRSASRRRSGTWRRSTRAPRRHPQHSSTRASARSPRR